MTDRERTSRPWGPVAVATPAPSLWRRVLRLWWRLWGCAWCR